MSKLGKNEAKRLQAAALREFHSEMDEDERERMLRRGMGGQEGGLIHKGVDQLVAKKLSKEEKKAILKRYEDELMGVARERVKKAQTKLACGSKAELARLAYLETQKFHLVNGNSRGNVGIRYVAAADPRRSSAQPMGM